MLLNVIPSYFEENFEMSLPVLFQFLWKCSTIPGILNIKSAYAVLLNLLLLVCYIECGVLLAFSTMDQVDLWESRGSSPWAESSGR